MLDSYKDKWPIVYKILSSSIKENKISHSYLFFNIKFLLFM